MRRFTFATGNARKVASLPIYALGSLASRVVPRNPRLWVFGSGSGVGEGALALLLHARAENPKLRLVWLARNERDLTDAASLGIKAVQKGTWRGFRLTLRAGVVVVTHGFGDVNRYGTTDALVVQLWHGVPFKRIHLDSPATTQIPLVSRFGIARKLIRDAYVRSARGISLFATASPLAATRIRSAFALPSDRVIVTGDPRDDVLSVGSADERRATARARILAVLGDDRVTSSRLILYAPTWRDGDADPAIPTSSDWQQIVRYLDDTDSLLIIRSHHLGAGDYSEGLTLTPRVRLLTSDAQPDVTPVLPAFDVVITDYSSIAFDYALVGGMLVYLAPDVADYISSHGVYERYRDFSGGSEVTSWSALVALLEAADRDPARASELVAHGEWVSRRVHSYRDGRNTARVYDAIVSRLAGSPGSAGSDAPHQQLAVDSVAVVDEGTELRLSGLISDREPSRIQLDGSRAQLDGMISVESDRWFASFSLITSRWNGPLLPPPSGRYNVRVVDSNGQRLDLRVDFTPPQPALYDPHFRLAVSAGATGLDVDFSAPLADDELGSANQSRFDAEYRRSRPSPDNVVFFESYFGQNVSCNPRALDRALSSIRPDAVRYWSVTDASVEVPVGGIAVIEGTAEWWRARSSARLLIVNDWLRKRYRKRPGRSVLQTWHGTPLKKIALDRERVSARTAIATRREKARWDLMLSQNDFSTNIFRSAYAVRKPIWQEGYPRDDILTTGDADAVRARLGIAPDTRIVLYAPTWRDDRPDKVDHLDVGALSRELGPDHVILIRGHSRTMRPGADVLASGVIDVTGYPDISELFLAADSLVTDYSSVMFDFTVTGKPIYFFAPDLAHYRDQLRGFYFDLLADAPGPVITEQAELIALLRGEPTHEAEYADRYAAWQKKYNPRDDGHAAERVINRLIAEGYLS
jgi:CDP-glycerol glycerophosphotransferase (TagB/SpsB family)